MAIRDAFLFAYYKQKSTMNASHKVFPVQHVKTGWSYLKIDSHIIPCVPDRIGQKLTGRFLPRQV